MKRWIILMAIGGFIASADGQTTLPAAKPQVESQIFDLTATGPPAPAMKYELMTDPTLRQSGNAAIYYLDAALQVGEDTEDALDHLNEGPQSGKAYDAAAEALYQDNKGVFALLESAARCDRCDWQTSFNQDGIQTALPRLGRMRLLADLVRARARQQMRDGDSAGALDTLQLGYELSRDVGREQLLISAEVSLGCIHMMDGATEELMQDPDSPNLYWALAAMPHPMVNLRHTMEGERIFELTAMPAGYLFAFGANYRAAADDLYKLWQLPYPVLIPRLGAMAESARQATATATGKITTVLDVAAPSLERAVKTFARVDRELAALTAVEAIRSYAAAHQGQLPRQLADVTDTPAPDNPATGKAFDYRLNGETAVLSDSNPWLPPLRYAIRIRR
ncbi:MAG TPA: hypothetical protein VMD30_06750 [Tepidisphaeraceae bacterium]|nr:hypothetical protein [Tepidisphaeraceae bacterium]